MSSYLPTGSWSAGLDLAGEAVTKQLSLVSPAAAAAVALWLPKPAGLARRLRRDSAVLLSAFALVGALGLAAVAGIAAATLAPDHAGPVAAVFPPWIDADDAVARVFEAGGVAIGERRAGLVVYAAGAQEGFAEALRAKGAWLLLDADGVAAFVGAPS